MKRQRENSIELVESEDLVTSPGEHLEYGYDTFAQ
jgi:hypothetical protein